MHVKGLTQVGLRNESKNSKKPQITKASMFSPRFILCLGMLLTLFAASALCKRPHGVIQKPEFRKTQPAGEVSSRQERGAEGEEG